MNLDIKHLNPLKAYGYTIYTMKMTYSYMSQGIQEWTK